MSLNELSQLKEQMNYWTTMETQICPGFILAVNLPKRSIGIIKLKKDHLLGKSLSVTFHSSREDKSSPQNGQCKWAKGTLSTWRGSIFIAEKRHREGWQACFLNRSQKAIAVARIETSCTFPFGETELLCNISSLAFLWQLEPELNGL